MHSDVENMRKFITRPLELPFNDSLENEIFPSD